MLKFCQTQWRLGGGLVLLATMVIIGLYFSGVVSAEGLTVVTYDDNAVPPLSYTGTWTYSTNSANAMWSTLHWSNVIGNKVT